MLRMVLDDYMHSFRTAWKDGINAMAWILYFDWLVCVPVCFGLESIKFLFGGISMMIGILLARMYPNQMGKIFFLCPLTKQDRKKYLETGYWLRVSIPMIICISTGAVSLAAGYLSLFYYLMICLMVFFFVIGVNIYCLPDKPSIYITQRKYQLPGVYEVWNILIQAVGILGMCLSASFKTYSNEVTDKVILLTFVLVEMLLSIKMCFTYYGPVMARGMQYESCHVVRTDGDSMKGGSR